MTKAKKAKKRNPQDATLRNTRAQKALIAALQEQLNEVNAEVTSLKDRVMLIEIAIAPPPQVHRPEGSAI